MTVRVATFERRDSEEWDELVAEAPMGTLLHTRRYLSYHRDRFDDRSLVLRDDAGRLVAVLPAAVDPADPTVVTSHPGVTYGGLVHAGLLGGDRAIDAFSVVVRHYGGEGFARLRYKAVPRIYHQRPSEDDLYALFRHRARRYRADLSCAIDLEYRAQTSERRRRAARRAARAGVRVEWSTTNVAAFWDVLAENLAARHSQQPVHSVEELDHLLSLFPKEILLATAHLEDDLVGGMLLFVTRTTLHSQYIASNARGRDIGAVDAVAEAAIRHAEAGGARFFNFGVSTEDEGRSLNSGLHTFKAEFGGGGVLHEFFELDLEPKQAT